MPIRVLLMIGRLTGGGSETQILRLLQSLDRTRYQPELYVLQEGGELWDDIPADVPVHVCHAEASPLLRWIPGQSHRARANDLARILDERKIELVVDRTYHMTLLTAAAVQKRPTARISIVVSDPAADFSTGAERFPRIKRKLLRKAYAEASVAGVVSESLRDRAARFHRLPVEQFDVIGNLYDVESIRSRAAESLPAEFAKREDVLRIVAVGRLHVAKAYDVLLDAADRLKQDSPERQFELLIVGDGPERSNLEQQIDRLQLTQTVRLVGFQANPLPFVAAADLFCLSSRYEGLPNALIEALIVGIPVVATDCHCGPREILAEGKWGALVPVDDPQALAMALGGALDHPAAFQKRAESAQRAIAETYSLPAGLARFDELAQIAIGRDGE